MPLCSLRLLFGETPYYCERMSPQVPIAEAPGNTACLGELSAPGERPGLRDAAQPPRRTRELDYENLSTTEPAGPSIATALSARLPPHTSASRATRSTSHGEVHSLPGSEHHHWFAIRDHGWVRRGLDARTRPRDSRRAVAPGPTSLHGRWRADRDGCPQVASAIERAPSRTALLDRERANRRIERGIA